ncbi:MAG: exopolysaccharide biosynthesis polyprenyl glycosylphosphotransferase, partial [Deltaproteobacteria bacterium]|nr:exopolysaccharide biosynthesis polyprenyl glycosylphosphotransferase [Deltaproteobacteria bacterium]
VVTWGRANPGKLRVGINPVSSAPVFAAAFARAANLDVVYVPFRGGGERAPALAGGHIDADFDIVAPLRPLSEAGKVRILAVAAERRVELYRDIATMREHASLGLRVIGVVTPSREANTARFGLPVLGEVRDLVAVVRAHHADQVVAALTIDELGALKDMMAQLSHEAVDVRVIPDFYQYMTLCGSVEELAGLPVINLQATPLMGWNLVAKRTFDLMVSGAGLVLLAPVFAGIAAAIRLTSGGPVVFRQQRVGMDGRRFAMLKFRTMRTGADTTGAQMTAPNDPRRTRLGAVLRRTSLDELPQLWNVLKGDMSLVGPRPEQPVFVEDFTRDIPRYALRHKIKAGMTGWAQVHGMRGNTSITKRIELDLYYIEN